MQEIPQERKIQILIDQLYHEVKLIIESQYNIEGIINPQKKDSTKIIFKDKRKAIQYVAKHIKDFASENNIETSFVKKEILLRIDNDKELNPIFESEYNAVEEMVKTQGEER